MQHERRGMIVLEVFVLVLYQNGRRERTEPLAMLDACVQDVFHVGQSRMRDDGTVAERSRSPLHASLKPSHDIACCDLLCDCFEQRLAFQFAIVQPGFLEIALQCASPKTPAPDKSASTRGGAAASARNDTCATQRQSPALHLPLRAESSSPERRFGRKACRWQHYSARSRPPSQDHRGHPLVQVIQQMEENFLETMLHGKREIHVALGNFVCGSRARQTASPCDQRNVARGEPFRRAIPAFPGYCREA